ncbi:MAG: hypothetical protein JWN78_321 [Bacteroidota bacterium]|nr:hypothetical protein [Bacteroidota bacterium]
MKRIFSYAVALLSLFIFSCNKSSQKDCEKNNTGSILFHNQLTGFDSVYVYLGSTQLGLIRTGGELSVGNLAVGRKLYTFKYRTFNLLEDSITVSQCNESHYYLDHLPVSDRRLKKNITPVKNVLADIEALNIYSYEYNAPKSYTGYLPGGIHFGFMAQELKDVYPEFVQLNTNGYYSVNYMEMIPILAQGIKEQQEEINDLKKEIAELRSMVKSQQAVAMK